jgi:hypothetical protein
MQELKRRKTQDNIATFIESRVKHYDAGTVCMICDETMASSSKQKIGTLKSALHFSNVDEKIVCEGSKEICKSCVSKTFMCPCCRLYWSEEDLRLHREDALRESEEASRRAALIQQAEETRRSAIQIGGDIISVPMNTLIEFFMNRMSGRTIEERRGHINLSRPERHRTAHIPIRPDDEVGKVRFKSFMGLLSIQAELDRKSRIGIAIVVTDVSAAAAHEYQQHFITWYATGNCSCDACVGHRQLCTCHVHLLGCHTECIFCDSVWGINPVSQTLILSVEN